MRDSLFLFNSPLGDPYVQQYLKSIAFSLSTVCSIMMVKPYIQYQQSSPFSELVAEHCLSILNAQTDEPLRGTLVIVD